MLFMWIIVFSLSGTAGVLVTGTAFLSFPFLREFKRYSYPA